MARPDETSPDAQPEPGGTLADAIAAHLALKQDHGADPEEVERERQSALAPARRDLDPSADLHPGTSQAPADAGSAATEPVPRAPEDATSDTVEQQPLESGPPEQPPAEPLLPAEPVEGAIETEVEAPAEPAAEPSPQDTGAFEFEWGGETDPPELEPEEAESAIEPGSAEPGAPEPDGPDLLQQTPEFFEETPEYDRLWFEERAPRDFDF